MLVSVFFFFPFISQMERQPPVLEVELPLPLLADLSFHWAPMPEHHLEERASVAVQEIKKKRQSCGRAKDVPEDVPQLVLQAEASGLRDNTEITRTHQLEAERNQLAIETGNNGGRTKKPTEQD